MLGEVNEIFGNVKSCGIVMGSLVRHNCNIPSDILMRMQCRTWCATKLGKKGPWNFLVLSLNSRKVMKFKGSGTVLYLYGPFNCVRKMQ